MFRRAMTAKAPPGADSEVRIQKVEKIELVCNITTKPSVYAKHMTNSRMHPTVGHEVISGNNKAGIPGNIGGGSAPKKTGPGVVHIEDINTRSERYIREKKKQFLG